MRSRRAPTLTTGSVSGFSPDIVLIVIVSIATLLGVAFDVSPIVRVPLALLTTLFVPGYTIMIALFPAGESEILPSTSTPPDQYDRPPEDGITMLERLVLSVGLSIAIIPIIGLLVNYIIGYITVWTLLFGPLASTLGAIPFAIYRRRQIPAEKRCLPLGTIQFAQTDNGILHSWKPNILSIVLALSILFATGAVIHSEVGVGLSNQEYQSNTPVTEFYFLADNESEELRTNRYPTEFTAGDNQTVSIAVGNAEGVPINYSVIGQIQQVQSGGNVTVIQQWRVTDSEVVNVPAGKTIQINDTVKPRSTSEQLRLVYLLYIGAPPDTPTIENSYRQIHVWITVSEPEAT